MARKNIFFKNKISPTGFIVLIFLFFSFVYAHPVNLTKMTWDVKKNEFKLRFVSYNLNKTFNTEVDAENFNKAKVFNYTLKHLKISNCKLIPDKIKISKEIVIDEYFKVKCKNLNNPKIYFDMFFDFDKTQRGVLRILDKNESVYTFSPQKKEINVSLSKREINFQDFLKLGIEHILTGYDHLTFLFMLMLPVILFANSFIKALIYIVEIATAFTISHSITLSLSVFNIVTPPANLIEILIAFSIFLTAINNLFHYVSFKREWLLAFLFGFIHGFGFANALKELDLQSVDFAKLVFGFNLGVEIGQFLVVLVSMPFLYFLVRKYKKLYIVLSIIGAILALLWMIDRITGIGFMPF